MGKRYKRQRQVKKSSSISNGFKKRKEQKLTANDKTSNRRRCDSSSSSSSSRSIGHQEHDPLDETDDRLPFQREEFLRRKNSRRSSTNSNTILDPSEEGTSLSQPLVKENDQKNLPNVDTLMENPVEIWYKDCNFVDRSYNENDPIDQDKTKLQRKNIGIKVVIRRPSVAAACSTTNNLEEDNIVFSLSKCPPPLPTDFFKILNETINSRGETDDNNSASTSTKDKKTYRQYQNLSQLLYEVHNQSKGKIIQPTPIQLQAWPILLSGKCKNILLVSPTGSGKTLCYGIGVVQFCLNALLSSTKFRTEDGPLALIMSPTRELSHQICHSLKQVTNCANTILRRNYHHQSRSSNTKRAPPKLKILPIYGGDGISRNDQLANFDPGELMTHIVAATPGRLLDLLGSTSRDNLTSSTNTNKMSLDNVCILIIDEIDKMMQLGFREQIDLISSKIRKDRMTVLLSATFPERLSKVCFSWLGGGSSSFINDNNIVVVKSSTIKIGNNDHKEQQHNVDCDNNPIPIKETMPSSQLQDTEMMGSGKDNRVTEISMIPSHIAQILHVCATHKKPKKLLGILRKLREAEREGGRTRNQGLLVIFFSKIKTLQFISKLLKKEAINKITELHGQLKQRERESALNDFKSGKASVLLSTDVAARGIHVNNIEYIINYDFPTSIEQVCFLMFFSCRALYCYMAVFVCYSFLFFVVHLSSMCIDVVVLPVPIKLNQTKQPQKVLKVRPPVFTVSSHGIWLQWRKMFWSS